MRIRREGRKEEYIQVQVQILENGYSNSDSDITVCTAYVHKADKTDRLKKSEEGKWRIHLVLVYDSYRKQE